MSSNTHKYLLIIGPIITVLAFLSAILNMFASGPGEAPFKRHLIIMVFILVGGIATISGIIMFLVKKFGDGKILNETAEKLGGKKITYNETVHGSKVDISGTTSHTNVVVGSDININQPVASKDANKAKKDPADHVETQELIRRLYDLIGSGKVKESLELLHEHFILHDHKSGIRDTVALLGRLNGIEKQFHTNGVTTHEMLQENAKINQSLLDIISNDLK